MANTNNRTVEGGKTTLQRAAQAVGIVFLLVGILGFIPGVPGTGIGNLVAHDGFAPHGIAVDSRGDIYVSEVTWTFAGSRGHVPATCHTFQKFSLNA